MAANEEREAALRSLYSFRDRLRADLRRCQDDLQAVERSIMLVGGESVAHVEHQAPQADPGYQGLGMQSACERLLHEFPDRKFKPSVAAKELLRRGMPKRGKTFGSQVAAALNRAAMKGIATKEEINGRLMYGLKNKAPEAAGTAPGA